MKNRPLPVDFSQKCVTFAINLRTQTEMADYEIFISCKSEDYEMAQRKFSGDKRKSWPNEIKNTFHQRLLLEML